MKLALSPGHHRSAKGAYSKHYDIYEHDLALEINRLINRFSLGLDIEIYNVSLDELKDKTEQVNLAEADFAIETHFNAARIALKPGFEVLYHPDSERSRTLANCLLQSFNQYLPFHNRGIKARTDLYFLNHTECPAVLIEPLFIDQDREMLYLMEYPRGKEILAFAVSQGVRAYQILMTPEEK